jgi:hypothetical protein
MRVKKYNGFLLDSLLESMLISTKDFKNILYDMPSDNKISDVLYAMIDDKQDIKTAYNYINQSDKNDEISFIPDNQYQRFIAKGDDIESKTKSKAKIGRMIRQILKDNGHDFSEPDIEKFVNQFKSTWNRLHGVGRKVEIVKGDDIIHWYNENNYFKLDGTLGNSCMRHPHKANFLRIYADNSNKCSLVTLRQDDKLLARALVWKLDDGRTYLDRIYSIQDNDMDFVYNWALQNIGDNNPNNLPSHFKGRQGVVKCTLDKSIFDEYPYADTMYYLYQEINDGVLTSKGFVSNEYNANDDTKSYIVRVLQNTDGGSNIQNFKWSDYQDKYVYNIDSVWASDVSSHVEKDITTYCESLSDYFIKDNCVWSERANELIPKKHMIDHPEFGPILKQMLVQVVTEYTGNQKDPIAIWSDINDNGSGVLDIKQDLKRNGNIPSFRPDSCSYRALYDSKFKVTDYIGDPQINFLCYEMVEVNGDSVPDELKFIVFQYRGPSFMTKIDSEVFEIKPISDNKSWIYAYEYMNTFSSSIYKSILKMIDDSNAQQSIKSTRIEVANQINNILRSENGSYRTANMLHEALGDFNRLDLLIDIFQETVKKLDRESAWSFRSDSLKLEDYIDAAIIWESSQETFDNNPKIVNFIHKYYKVFLLFYFMSRDSYDARELLGKFLREIKSPDYEIFGEYIGGESANSMIRSVNRYGSDDTIVSYVKDSLEDYATSKDIETRIMRITFPEIVYDQITRNFNSSVVESISKLVKSDSKS